jgi:hypothetical protein
MDKTVVAGNPNRGPPGFFMLAPAKFVKRVYTVIPRLTSDPANEFFG